MDKLEKLYKEWKSLFPISGRKRYLLSRRFSVDYNFIFYYGARCYKNKAV